MTSSTKKKHRAYRLGRRAEAADETRRRIVLATSDLHAERGIADTSMKDIAARAGVSVGTVYHHFPTYPDAIAACGAYTAEQVPAPTEAVFEGTATRGQRVARLAEALFDYYERVPALASVRRDRHVAESLEQFVAAEADNRLTLAARAIGTQKRGRHSALVAALFDLDVYRALRRQGFDTATAAERIAALVNGWLDHAEH
ncbi:MAG TPA: helix-turn-helix domain-containing protein [Woeseiaceae bacterium]|nr:helix-turn-helix domain-containing protein [Woeseiaceae bacterium]